MKQTELNGKTQYRFIDESDEDDTPSPNPEVAATVFNALFKKPPDYVLALTKETPYGKEADAN